MTHENLTWSRWLGLSAIWNSVSVFVCPSVSTEHSDWILKTTALENPHLSACCLRISSDAMVLPSRQTAHKSSQYNGCGTKVSQRAPTLAQKMPHQSDCPKGHQIPSAQATDPFWVKAPESHLTKFLYPSSKTGKSYVQAQSRSQLRGFRTVSPPISLVCKNG